MHLRRLLLPETLDPNGVRILCEALEAHPAEAGPLVLEGGAATFCKGLDPAASEATVAAFAQLLGSLYFLPCPTLAVVRGAALGGGCGLAAACDGVVAVPEARFGLPEGLFGLLPAMVAPVLLRRMAPQQVRLLALGGGSIGAERARELGLVDRVVPPEALEAALQELARGFRRLDPGVVGPLKALVEQAARLPLPEALRSGAQLTTTRLRLPEVREALRAFHQEGLAPWLARASRADAPGAGLQDQGQEFP